ncbi:Protein C12orf4 [Nymphon striatum]|nr:Protein C12orf4 [Nymphon striatum]
MFRADFQNDRNYFVDFLAILFGMGSWLAVNGNWSELSILEHNLPEAWDISSYMSVIIQLANIVPVVYAISHKCCPGVMNANIVINVIMFIGAASYLLLVFYWNKTAYIAGQQHSVAFFALLLCISIVDCTSSVVFFPFMGLYRKVYLKSFLVGESLSGLVPGLVALAQGASATECRAVHNVDNVTGEIVASYKDLSSARLRDDNSTKVHHPTETTPLIVHTDKESNILFAVLLITEMWDSTLGKGFLPTIQNYSCLPYGDGILYLTETLSMITSPFVCICCLFVKLPKRYGILVTSIIGTVAAFYIITTAAYSPTPPLHGTSIGTFLIVLAWVLKSGTFSFSKCCIANKMREEEGSALLWLLAIRECILALLANAHFSKDTKQFTYVFQDGQCKLKAPVPIPLNVSEEEFVGRLLTSHNNKIPCYIKEDLLDALTKFVAEETSKYYDDDAVNSLEMLKNESEDGVNKLVENIAAMFEKGHAAYAKPEGISDEEVFADAYHSLIHSPALETILNLEHTYATAVEDTVNKKISESKAIEERQSIEMQECVEGIGLTSTDDDVNNFAAKHFEENQLVVSRWESQLSVVKEQQKREYKDWVMTVHEDFHTSPDSSNYLQRVRNMSFQNTDTDDCDWSPQPTRMEESYTIHLGAQMKTTHNLRLMSTDILDLCKHRHNIIGGVIVPQPQRLQTAMALYSTNLCGMVLLVDDRLNSFSGIKKDFAEVCDKSTEFHFPDNENQLEAIKKEVVISKEWRTKTSSNKCDDKESNKLIRQSSEDSVKSKQRISVGGFYITRHSNLAEVHVVFHMVTDDSLISNQVTSRHPVILGLRNVLKVACEKDVNTVTVPLLLVHEMTEEMTIQWCLKRAELVFKCVKGFMIEILSWGGSETRTIQFLLPKGISEDLFQSLSTMLPSIFRMANPLVLQAS